MMNLLHAVSLGDAYWSLTFPQMPDGQIIQYEHDGTFLQEQQVRSIIWNAPHSNSSLFWQTFIAPYCFCVQIAVSHDGQIQYLPVSSEQQIVNAEDLEAAAQSAVTGRLSEGTDGTSPTQNY